MSFPFSETIRLEGGFTIYDFLLSFKSNIVNLKSKITLCNPTQI